MKKSKEKTFIYGTVVLTVSMIIVKVIGALFKIPLLNILKETGMAYFSSAYTVFTIFYAFSITGFSTAVAKMIAESKANGKIKDTKRIMKIAFLVFFLIGFSCMILLTFFSKPLSQYIGSPNSYLSILIISPAILFCSIMAAYRGYYEGLNDMLPTAISQVIEAIIKLLSGLLFAGLTLNFFFDKYSGSNLTNSEIVSIGAPYAAAAAMFGLTLSTLGGMVYLIIYHKIKNKKNLVISSGTNIVASGYKELWKKLIRIAIPITLSAVVMQLSTMIDMVTIMNRLKAASEANPDYFINNFSGFLNANENINEFLYGIYIACVTIFNFVPAFTSLIGKSALPGITSHFATHNREVLCSKISDVIRVTLMFCIPAGVGISFMASPILDFLYKNNEATILFGIYPLIILGIGSICIALINPINAIFQSCDKVYTPVRLILFASVIKLILNYILVAIPQLNIIGAAISTLASYLIVVVLELFLLRKIRIRKGLSFVNIGLKLDIFINIFKLALSAVLCGGTAIFLYNLLISRLSPTICILLSVIVGGIIYLISLFLFRFIRKNDILLLPKGKKIAKTLEKYKIL